jgi:ABC-2 type transport system ATP-binding protein
MPPDHESAVTDLSADDSSPTELMPAFEFRNLHRYFGRLKAVHNVTFKAFPGDVVGFIGPNGAGKTTSMRILATLDTPTSGDAYVMGYSVVDDPDRVRTVLGFMPDAYGRYANVSVYEYLDFFARAYGLRGDERRSAVDRVMTFTELHTIRDKPIENLSKGLAQRLGLGRTLIHDPQVLILDEPAAGLDPRARVELRELIRLLASDLHKTILISSHILTELSEICDSAVIIEAGRILAGGTVDQILNQLRNNDQQSAVKIAIRVLENPEKLERELVLQPLVSNVIVSGKTVTFEYEGTELARAGLIRTLIQSGHQIVDFSSRTENLEDAFMAITKGIMQ